MRKKDGRLLFRPSWAKGYAMAKRIVYLIFICIVLTGIRAYAAQSFFEDFELYAPGKLTSGANLTITEKTSASGGNISVLENEKGKYAQVFVDQTAVTPTSTDAYIESKTLSMNGIIHIGCKIMAVDSTQGGGHIALRDNSSNAGRGTFTLAKVEDGKLTFLPDISGFAKEMDYEDGTWVYINAYINSVTGFVEVIADGQQQATLPNLYTENNGYREDYNFSSFRIRLHVKAKAGTGRMAVGYDDCSGADEETFINDYTTYYRLLRDTGNNTVVSTEGFSRGKMKVAGNILTRSNAVSLRAIAVLYDADGVLEDISVSPVINLGPHDIKYMVLDIDVKDTAEGKSLRVLTFDGGNIMKVLGEPKTFESETFIRPLANEIKYELAQKSPNKKHPRLLADTSEWNRIKADISNDPLLRSWYFKVKPSQDNLLNAALASYEDNDPLRLSSAGTIKSRCIGLSLMYRLTGDTAYAERLWLEMENAMNFPDWNPKHFLDTAAVSTGFGIAYDWLYHYWSNDRKVQIREAILNYALIPAMEVYVENKWGNWDVRNNNWNIICSSGVAIGALAIMDEEGYEDISSTVVSYALSTMEPALKMFAPDGAWFEGPGYWQYTVSFLAVFMNAMETALGTDFSYGDVDGMPHTADFPIYMMGAKVTYNLNDAGESKVNSPEMFYYAKRYNEPGYSGYRRYCLENGIHNPGIMDLIWYRPADDGEFSMPLDKLFRDTDIAVFRNKFFGDDIAFAGLHSGDNDIPHGQLDTGSFVYDALGERWALDLGGDNYSLHAYFSNGNLTKGRWGYYRNRAEGHNTLIINPSTAPDQKYNAVDTITSYVSKDDYGFAVADMSSAYSESASEARRGLMFFRDSGACLVQDEVTLRESSDIHWFMHTRASVTIAANKKSAVLTIGTKRLWVGLLSDGGSFSVMNAVPLETSPKPDAWAENISLGIKQNANSGVRKLTVQLSGEGEQNIAVYMVPLSAGQQQPSWLPEITPLNNWE